MQSFHPKPASFELAITTDSPVTIAAINTFIDEALRYGKDAESSILKGIAADPTCAIAHAYAASYYLSQESSIGWQQAIPHLKAARKYSRHATEREQLYVQAIAHWANGDIQAAIAIHETLAERYPQDLMSVQQGQYHYFYLGDKAKLLQIAEQVLPTHRENHYLLGMMAFGLEQCHRLEEAETMARAAIAINSNDPWAHHAIAHVMETQGRIEEGIAWMEAFAHTWETCNSMLYTHNWWHIALYHLTNRDYGKVLSLYDTHIWGRARKDSPKDQVGAISLLLRLELKELVVDRLRWKALAAHLLPRIHEHALPFQDLHYVYALARVGQADEMLASMEAHSRTIVPQQRTVWRQVVLPAAQGLAAYAEGNWQGTIALLHPVLPRLYELGGSHTQRDLFNQLYQDAQRRQSHLRRSRQPRYAKVS
jgi:tetratricopeptide (TPR) repeat protein